MKNSLLLLMTPNMSLRKWDELGQLSREMNYYRALCRAADLKLLIFSYGRMDSRYIQHDQNMTVLEMPGWIPTSIPFKVQNLIYHLSSLFIYRKFFKNVVLAKTNQFRAFKIGLLLKLFFGIPLVVRMGFYYSHFQRASIHRKIFEWIAFKFSDLIITTSSEATAFIISKYRVKPCKILSMCNAIDLDVFKPLKTEKKYDLVFVGRLERQKNIDLVVKIISSPDLKTLIIGKGSLSEKIAKAIQKNKLITWKDKVDNSDLPNIYNSAKCLIIVSEYEGSPKVMLEAMACGLPIIATETPGIRECIVHNSTGIFVNPNIHQIGDDVLDLIRDNVKTLKLGNNARQWAMSYCDMSKNIQKEVSFYSNHLNTNKFAYSN